MISVLIKTHLEDGKPLLPHLHWLKNSNPDSEINVIVQDDIIGVDKKKTKVLSWKNSDRELRNWWAENREKVSGETVCVIEWDTLINCLIPQLPDNLDLASAIVLFENVEKNRKWSPPKLPMKMSDSRWTEDDWMWWKEVRLLQLPEGEIGCGLVSFGFYLMRRKVLDDICDPIFDKVYRKDIISELRFPTCAKLKGARVGKMNLPHVLHKDLLKIDFLKNEIYHPIKHEMKV